MFDIIKKLLRENLEELATLNKPVYAQGVEHVLYKSQKNPNVLYKIGQKSNVLKWSKVFKSNEKLFPKVYKVGVLPDGNYYVEIEKLDTKRAVYEWNYMEDKLELLGIVDTDVFESTLQHVFIDILKGYKSFNGIKKRLAADPRLLALFKKWVNFLSSTYNYIFNFGYQGLDIHKYNFAYDVSGNIKAIDI